jgi:hypothetical protein
VTALLGIAHVARTDGAMDEQLLADLEEQVEHLKRAVLLLRRLPWFGFGEARLVRLRDVVGEAVELYEKRAGARVAYERDGAAESSPIWLQVSQFQEVLLDALAASEEIVGGQRLIRVRLNGEDGDRVEIEAELPARSAAAGVEAISGVQSAERGMEALGGDFGCEIEPGVEGGRLRMALTLPAGVPPPAFPDDPGR